MTNICRHCGVALKDGDARYTLNEPEFFAHYDCHKNHKFPISEPAEVIAAYVAKSSARLDMAIDGLKAVIGLYAFDTGRQPPILWVLYTEARDGVHHMSDAHGRAWCGKPAPKGRAWKLLDSLPSFAPICPNCENRARNYDNPATR